MPSALASPTSASVHVRTCDDAAGHLRATRVADRLDGVDRQQERPLARRAICSTCSRSRPGANRTASPGMPSRRGPRRDLGVRLLAAHQQAVVSLRGEVRHEVQEQRGLADAGLTRRAGRPTRARGHRRARDRRRGTRSTPARPRPASSCSDQRSRRRGRRSPSGPDDVRLLDRAPAAAARTSPDPLRHLLPAIAARQHDPCLAHRRHPRDGHRHGWVLDPMREPGPRGCYAGARPEHATTTHRTT